MAQINKPNTYFNTKLHTGTGAEATITGIGFQPDLVWSKSRSNTEGHTLIDGVRGAGNALVTNTTSAEATGETQMLKSFNSDGFVVGVNGQWNASAYTYVYWNWLAGGTAVSNTDGSITSSVSANQTAGFSIATFTAPSAGTVFDVGHGLNGKPDMMITKAIDGISSWWVWHIGLGDNTTDYLSLNTTNAEASASGMWGTVGAGNSTFGYTAGTSAYVDIDNVAYFFKSIKGFSKFGSYTGNGVAGNGTFVYTGFKPAWLLVRQTDIARSWKLLDNKRDSYNDGTGANLNANDSSAEDDNVVYAVDFLSNGFKIRNTNGNFNASGGNYIYMAFAENPLVGTNNIPTTAR